MGGGWSSAIPRESDLEAVLEAQHEASSEHVEQRAVGVRRAAESGKDGHDRGRAIEHVLHVQIRLPLAFSTTAAVECEIHVRIENGRDAVLVDDLPAEPGLVVVPLALARAAVELVDEQRERSLRVVG